ncbi:hypothetical protein [Muricoccus radiodurans]|uniref:hypothetical protein n=1 Tax=Muricoccus radiodurans TaxID=2231721 RepID=UPI003CFAE7F2
MQRLPKPDPRASAMAALAAALIAVPVPVMAQIVRPLPAPMSPASEAPAPPNLSARPRPSAVPVIPALALPAEFAVLPEGGWRLSGVAGRAEPDGDVRRAVETIGRYLAEFTTGRVTVLVQVSGPADDASIARRTSLARAIAIKTVMTRAGLPGTRVDLRPMGRTEEARDGVDILAPPPRRSAAAGR